MAETRLLYFSKNDARIDREERIVGEYLYDKNKEVVARIEGLLLDDFTWEPRYLVITQGGFLGTQGKKIILPRELYEIKDVGKVVTSWSQAFIQEAPSPHDLNCVDKNEESRIRSYFALDE